MSPALRFRAVLATMLVAMACSDESTTSLAVEQTREPEDLVLMFPTLDAETLVQGEFEEVRPDVPPAGVLSDGGPSVPDEEVFSQIIDARTTVGFTADWAFSTGRQRYTGNKGRVETMATLTYDGVVIGTQPAFREEYVAFLLDFGSIKDLWAEAYIFTDQECGLKVDGDSKHYAGWQWFLGGPAPNWGPASESTQAFPPVSQPACPVEDVWPDGGPTGGNESGGAEDLGPVTCWYWVTYDPYTGEIYDADFLFCDGVSEGG